MATNALHDQPLPMYGDGLRTSRLAPRGDHAGGIDFALRHGHSGEAYNVPGGTELPNREVLTRLLRHLGKPWSLVRSVSGPAGHDRRYAMSGANSRTSVGRRPRGSTVVCPRPSTGTPRTRRGGRR